MKTCLRNSIVSAASIVLLAVAPLALTGCDQEEEILDVETPDGELEVEQDPETGTTEIETDESPGPAQQH